MMSVEPMAPIFCKVTKITKESSDIVTLEIEAPPAQPTLSFEPGQFNMLYAFGIGEIPISFSGAPRGRRLIHTIRGVGAVSRALCRLKAGDSVGIRGPYGSPWPVSQAEGCDVVVAAGGLGIAPLRPVLYELLANSKRYRSITLLYGVRQDTDFLFLREIREWAKKGLLNVELTVGEATSRWQGNVGHLTTLIPHLRLVPYKTFAFVCGPEIMMRFAAREFQKIRVSPGNIFLSLERNMKCAIGHCGRCQYREFFVCKNGPVFPYDCVEPLLKIREL